MSAAMRVASSVRADQLDCSVSFARQVTDYSPDAVFSLALKSKKASWHFVWREPPGRMAPYWDVVGSVEENGIEYFLWVTLSPEAGRTIVNEFDLQKHNW